MLAGPVPGIHLERIDLPPGFEIQLFCDNVPGARSLAWSREGVLFVGTRDEGKVYALPDRDKDFRADKVIIIAEGLHMPNGVALRQGDLYVAEVSRIIRYDDITDHLESPPKPTVINDRLPDDEHHGWKYIAFGPDDRLYVPVGAPCNVCNPSDDRFATIMRMTTDGAEQEIFASGIRNTVGFDWHPVDKALWFTDNGRDWMGDDQPPDELNRAVRPGLHFGFPFCHGDGLKDPDLGDGVDCDKFVRPIMELGPHVAALGMKFYTGDMFPETYRGDVFIAEHGSWNRKVPIGYRITRVRLEGGRAVAYEVFAKGWLQGIKAWGRPV
ncbi:MAG: PQQ-dependent sugar dehydrogenase, partial [Desulfosudaceae bacterium]